MPSTHQQRRNRHLIIGIVASLVALWWSLAGVEWGSVGVALGGARLWLFIPIVVLFWLHYLVRSYRWRYLLPPPHRAPIGDLFDGLVIGGVATYLLPLRAGEFIRPYIVSRRGSYPYPVALASVVIERFFDLAAVLLSFGIVVSNIAALPSWVNRGAQGLGVLAGFLLAGIIVGAWFRSFVVASVRALTPFLKTTLQNRLIHFVDDLLYAAVSLRDIPVLLRVLGATVLVWGSTFFSFYLFICMIPALPVSLTISIAVTIVIALSVAAPSAPGFVGIYQAGSVAALSLYGVSAEDAVAFAIISHAAQYIMVLTFGAFSIQRQGVRWGELRDQVRNEESPLDVVDSISKKGS